MHITTASTRTAHATRVLGLFLAVGLLLAACGDDDGSSDAAAGTTTTTQGTADTGDAAAAGDATVMVANDAELGDHLVDSAGRTVYLFEKDQGTTTACTGACVDNWPPLIADGSPTGADGVDSAELSTADGIRPDQVTYHGHLLYYFAGDTVAGDTNGTAVPSWYAVAPSGDAIDKD